MLIGTSGIVVNEYGEVLLIRRNDTRTMAPPGGSLDWGELPDMAVAREVRQETGLIVMPVRLVGLYYLRWRFRESLNLVFRCLQRGGQLAPSEESLEVAFFPPGELPRPMAEFHHRRVSQGITHEGGPPYLIEEAMGWRTSLVALRLQMWVYPRLRRRRLKQGLPPYQNPPDFTVSSYVVAKGIDGRVLWVRRAGTDAWQLPGAVCLKGVAPWQVGLDALHQATGLRPAVTGLAAFYLDAGANQVDLVFEADLDCPPPAGTTPDIACFSSGEEPASAVSEHVAWVAQVLPAPTTVFRRTDSIASGDSRDVPGA